eukprot:Amastigsp_a175054_37.p1 type:complete len:237 gc:universal Amastigsp_a175054_37:1250-540(-)
MSAKAPRPRAGSASLDAEELERPRKKRKVVAPPVDVAPMSSDELARAFAAAVAFTRAHHGSDLARIDKRRTVVESFDEFFVEYTYVIVASGFRAKTAARMLGPLVACGGDEARMLEVFKNKAKVKALAEIWQRRDEWPQLRASFTSVDALKCLPRIGDTVKFHLARNIGLDSVAKPDLHLMAFAKAAGATDVHAMVRDLATANSMAVGSADFCLWVWLSHGRGATNECCDGGFELR